MFGREYDSVPRLDNRKYGIYYHLQYHDIGPHLAPQTGLTKLYYNLKKATEKGDNAYFILNVSNVREFDFEWKAYAQMLWDINSFCEEEFLDGYASLYGEQCVRAKEFVKEYFGNLPTLPTEYLRYVHAKYFNYNYQEIVPSSVKNFVLKDELVMVKGSEVIWHFTEELPSELYEKMYLQLKTSIGVYEKLADALQRWSENLPDTLKRHVQCKWWLYSKTLLHFYRWFVDVYEGKLAYDEGDLEQTKEKFNEACNSLEEYLSLRKCAEYGEFENWYRGETKVNVAKRLLDTRTILEKISKKQEKY